MGFAMVGVLMASGSLNIGEIILTRAVGGCWLELGPGCSRCSSYLVFRVLPWQETNRAPFDVAGEGDRKSSSDLPSTIPAWPSSLFLVAEYVNMMFDSHILTSIFFRRLAVAAGWVAARELLFAQPNFFWLALKTAFFTVQFPMAPERPSLVTAYDQIYCA